MDYNFDDILKEFGIGGEEESPAPAETDAPEERQPLQEPEENTDTPEEDTENTDSDEEFDFSWPEPEPERTVRPKRNYDPEKYPDAVKARAREKAMAEKAAEQAKRAEARKKAISERNALEEKRTKARENARDEKERERLAERKRREQEREEAKANREAERRAAMNAKDAEREARERERISIQEGKRRAKEAYNKRHFQERRQGRIGLIIFLILILLIGGGAFFAGRTIAYSGKNMPNLYVGSIPVGKLTRQQTEEALTAGGWQARTETPLTVTTYCGVAAEVDPVEAGAVLSLEDAVNEACAFGHNEGIIHAAVQYFECSVSHVDINRINTMVNTAYIQQKASEVEEKLQEALGQSEYTVDIEGEVLTVTKGHGSMELDSAALYEQILSAVENGETELLFTQLSREPVMPDFDALYAELAADPADARYSDDGKFTVIPETVGVWFDIENAKAVWQQAQPGETITIPVKVTRPSVTAAELESRLFHDMLGAMTTKYTNSGDNRCSNVRLATSKLDGYILYPGETISYNEVVGARTEEAGFLPAPAYTGVGEDAVKDEIGGGACQVSSTLYCATLYAFLETVERTAHVYPVNYIQMGTDATVTIPQDGGNVMDLKFRNNKTYPIKIVGYTEESEELKTVTFEIWGTLEDDDYMPIEFDNSYYWMLDYDRLIEPAYPDREGYKIKFTCDRYSFEDALGSGTRTLTHRTVYDSSGVLVLDEIINPEISTGYAMDTYYNH